MKRLDRLLGYAAAHPNGRQIFRASEMVLRSLSDASYLSRPRAGSVAGSHHFLGDADDNAPLNHRTQFPPTPRVSRSSTPLWQRSSTLVSSPSPESPRMNVRFWSTWGTPNLQHRYFATIKSPSVSQPTPSISRCQSRLTRASIGCGTVWQGHFRIIFVPGHSNVADFFTKALPVARHRILAPFFAIDPI
jgi:hypothetical protein